MDEAKYFGVLLIMYFFLRYTNLVVKCTKTQGDRTMINFPGKSLTKELNFDLLETSVATVELQKSHIIMRWSHVLSKKRKDSVTVCDSELEKLSEYPYPINIADNFNIHTMNSNAIAKGLFIRCFRKYLLFVMKISLLVTQEAETCIDQFIDRSQSKNDVKNLVSECYADHYYVLLKFSLHRLNWNIIKRFKRDFSTLIQVSKLGIQNLFPS